MAPSPPTVLLRDVAREYAPGRGVCGVSLEIAPGECFVVLGRNGSGKSTLIRLLLGLERPDSGTVEVLGACPASSRRHLARTGAAMDTSVHWEELTGRQNAQFVARACGMTPSEAASTVDSLFELADLTSHIDSPVSTYSFGMRRKLSLIEALCHDPDLLVLDEPTAGLDAHFLLRLTEALHDRARRGKTNWVASNDADWVAAAATRVGFINEGRLLAQGTVEQMVRDILPVREVRIELAALAAIPTPTWDDLKSFAQEDRTIHMLAADDKRLVPRVIEHIISSGGQVRSVQVLNSSLRDAFLLKTNKVLDA